VIALVSDAAQRQQLQEIARSRPEPASRVERARIILGYLAEPSAYAVGVTAQTVSRCLDRAAELGVIEALDDRQRTGRDPTITLEARTWLVALACQKPKALGYSHELWTTRLLAAHARDRGPPPATPVWPNSPKGWCARSSPITRSSRTRACPRESGGALLPGKARSGIRAKMAEILCIYRQVAVLREQGQGAASAAEGTQGSQAIISYDEKPGIQAIGHDRAGSSAAAWHQPDRDA
jgi:Homeodomain-like domain